MNVPGPRPQTPRTLALAHLTIEEASPLDAATAAARAGFRAVGLRITGFSPQEGTTLVNDALQVRALHRLIESEGLSIVNVCSYRLTPEIRAVDYRPVFDICAELGATTMLATCFIDDFGQASTLLGTIASEARPYGIRIGLEFFRSSMLKDLAAAEKLRIASGQANVGHIADALHLWRAGNVPADFTAIDPALIYGVQVCDAPLRSPPDDQLKAEIRNRLMPGEGELPLDAYLAELPRSLPVEIEAPHGGLTHLPVIERARRAYASGRRFIADPARKFPRSPL